MPETVLSRRAALSAINEEEAAHVRSDGIAVRVLAPMARLSLRIAPALAVQVADVAGLTLDLPINHRREDAGCSVLRLGPDEWLLCGPEGDADEWSRAVAAGLAGLAHSLVDVSHAYVTFAVGGAKAAEAINAGCPLDLWPQVFQAGHATRTLLGKAEIILARPGEARAFEITCARSYAAYVRDLLREAARGAG
jgi:sarcosine oxidase subunit gamma